MRLGFKVIMGCDITSHDLKEEVITKLRGKGYDVTDAGTSDPDHGDFAVAAEVVCKGIQKGDYKKGILICGTGQGMCMLANKYKDIRAALCYERFPAILAAADNDPNVLCTGTWYMPSADYCVQMIEAWLLVKYTGRDIYGQGKMKEFEEN